MRFRAKFFMKLFKSTVVVSLIFFVKVVSAQVSNVEGIKPLKPVTVQKSSSPETNAPGAVFKDCSYCPEMVVIAAGQFVMGASPGEEENEKLHKNNRELSQPQHRVEIKRFAIGKYSVTRAQYEVFVNETGRQSDGCMVWTGSKIEQDLAKNWRNPGFAQDDRHPVTCVSWDDAITYVQWLSQKMGKEYRLPSEAEWEYAARAGTNTYRYWGDDGDLSCAYANVADNTALFKIRGSRDWVVAKCSDGYVNTAPVGSFKPNRFGLFDMLGNVWQWTQDCGNKNYIGAPTDGSAWTTGNCSQRIARGGSWWYVPSSVRSASRAYGTTEWQTEDFGFRVAMSL
jgi:formylglycine-generating enzyme